MSSDISKPICLGNADFLAQFDPHSGAWVGLFDKATGEQLATGSATGVPTGVTAARAASDAPAIETGEGVKLVSHRLDAERRELHMTLLAAGWRVEATYQFPTSSNVLGRSFVVENTSGQARPLRGVGFLLPALSVGADMSAMRPDTKRVGNLKLERLSARHGEPSPKDGLCYLRSEGGRRGIGTWFHCEEEFGPLKSCPAGTGGAYLEHCQEVLANVPPGGRVSLGTQFLWLCRGTRDDILRSVQEVYALVGLRPPPTGLHGLAKRVLYCGHPGGTPEQHFIGYGGFKALEAYVPTLKKMGFNLLWMLPIFEHGDGTRGNLYSPVDQFAISPRYGSTDELKLLLASCRAAGIDVMFDLVPHGPPDDSALGKEHPDWVCRDETGNPVYEWSQLAFDLAHPGWQEYMRRVAAHHAREHGIVGARIDVATGSPPNWSAPAPRRPSFSTLGGGLGMCRAIREGLLEARADAVILPEEYTAARIFYRVADLTYDASLFLTFVDLQARNAPPEEWAATLQLFLHDQALTLPPGALKMRFVGNHDTVSWTVQKRRPRLAYGFERARALHSLCCLVDGVPMVYQGEEDPAIYGGEGPSIVNHIASLIACRRELPAFIRGVADYCSVWASGGVFAGLWQADDEYAVVLVSFNPATVQSRLSLPGDVERLGGHWQDRLSGEVVSLSAVPMQGHQVRVLIPDSSRVVKEMLR